MFGFDEDDQDRCHHCGQILPHSIGGIGNFHMCEGVHQEQLREAERLRQHRAEQQRLANRRRDEINFLTRHGVDAGDAHFITGGLNSDEAFDEYLGDDGGGMY